MYTDILQDLGLSPNESRIYEALLEFSEASVTEIATHTNIHRRNAYDAINRLVEKGFIVPVIGSKERRYVPVEPNKFLEVVEEKRSKLQKILPGMQEMFEKKRVEEGVYIYKGVEGNKNVLRDMLNISQTVYTIGAKAGWANLPSFSTSEGFIKEAKRKNIKFYALFDADGKKEVIETIKKPSKILYTDFYQKNIQAQQQLISTQTELLYILV